VCVRACVRVIMLALTIFCTFGRLERHSKTASGPPFLKSCIEIDVTLLAGMRPAVFSSTHYI
jgi:hypothetical protein